MRDVRQNAQLVLNVQGVERPTDTGNASEFRQAAPIIIRAGLPLLLLGPRLLAKLRQRITVAQRLVLLARRLLVVKEFELPLMWRLGHRL